MKKQILSALILIFPLISHAFTYETVRTSGQGETLDQAIDIGLRRAVEQVSGVSIDSNRNNTSTYSVKNENTQYDESMRDGTKFTSKGNVKYRILNEQCHNKNCTVNLEVKVGVDPRDKIADLNANRRTIAIGSFTGDENATIKKKLKELLVQDRKFKVINNKNDPSLQYVVTGKVIKAKTDKRIVDNSKTIELTGEKIHDVKTYYQSEVLVEFSILDVINNQIKWSSTIPTTSSRNNLSLLIDLASKKIFNQLKENIYPLVVLVGSNGSLILNSGGNTIEKGEYFDIFNLGEKFIDPITKESLGRDEIKVATVKVINVRPKFSYLSVVSGEKEAIKNHSIARKSLSKTTSKSIKPKPKSSSGDQEEKTIGIIL